MTQIKFCGLSRPEDAEAVAKIRPDYAGFVFWPGSRRYVSADTAVLLADIIPDEVQTVGVFMDDTVENILGIASTGCIDVVQLHGNESERYVRMVKRLTGFPVIKAFRINDPDTLERAYSTDADHVMFDSGAGTGRKFDWKVLDGFDRPFFLAGGLDPSNVAAAIKGLRPFAVDTSSGIETDGHKDPVKMEQFKRAVEEADSLTDKEE